MGGGDGLAEQRFEIAAEWRGAVIEDGDGSRLWGGEEVEVFGFDDDRPGDWGREIEGEGDILVDLEKAAGPGRNHGNATGGEGDEAGSSGNEQRQ